MATLNFGEEHCAELAWIATEAIIPTLTTRFRLLGISGATTGQVRTFIIGGGAPDYSTFVEQLEAKLGYNSGACTYKENADFWGQLGVSIDIYNVMCEASA